jgi:hypothetical protein
MDSIKESEPIQTKVAHICADLSEAFDMSGLHTEEGQRWLNITKYSMTKYYYKGSLVLIEIPDRQRKPVTALLCSLS